MSKAHWIGMILMLCPFVKGQGEEVNKAETMAGFRHLVRGQNLPKLFVQNLSGEKVELLVGAKIPTLLAFLRQDQEESRKLLGFLQKMVLDPQTPRVRVAVVGRMGSSGKGWTLVAKTLPHRISLYLDSFGASKKLGVVVMPSLLVIGPGGRVENSFLLYESKLQQQVTKVLEGFLGKNQDSSSQIGGNLLTEITSNAEGLEAVGKFSEALDLRKQQMEIAGKNADVLASIGRLLAKLGRFKEAVGTLRESLAKEDSIVIRVHLGFALFSLGKLAKAQKVLGVALPLSPDKKRIHYVLALIAKKQGDLDLALHHIKAAIEGDYPQGRKKERLGKEEAKHEKN
jgi:tetratricopeptide (TPR) repeat protein